MHHRGHVGNFNPRAPRGARPGAGRRSGASAGFQSTRPSRGATALAPATRAQAKISIHAPLAGRDRGHRQFYLRKDHFNPRAPRGARLWELKQRAEDADFNPRAPRGARLWSTYSFCQRQLHFNPRAPRGARPVRKAHRHPVPQISIHAPLAGRDYGFSVPALSGSGFQSTRPSRGATRGGAVAPPLLHISIHAPLAGRDSKCAQKSRTYLR